MRSFFVAALVTASLVVPQMAIAQQRVVQGGVTYSRPGPMHGGGSMRPPATRPMAVHGTKPTPGWNGGGRPNPGWNGGGKPMPGWSGGKPNPGWSGHANQGPRPNWGGKWNGRWAGGWRAPGGWNSYRQPVRGYVLPSYWAGSQFAVGNYASYGLSSPPYGYHWSRYYDDAVLADDGGRVWDSVSGLDWNDYDEGYSEGYEDGAQQSGGYYAEDGYSTEGYDSGYAYDDLSGPGRTL